MPGTISKVITAQVYVQVGRPKASASYNFRGGVAGILARLTVISALNSAVTLVRGFLMPGGADFDFDLHVHDDTSGMPSLRSCTAGN